MHYTELRQLAQRRLRDLGLTPPLDLDALRRALERERETVITVIASDEIPPGSAFGVTARSADQEIILHESRTTRSHQELILLHEYAHMLLRHPPSGVLHTQAGSESFQEIDAGMVAEVLGLDSSGFRADEPSAATHDNARRRRRWWPASGWSRQEKGRPAARDSSLYARAAEHEAETLATILLGWVPGQAGYIPSRPRGGSLGDLLDDDGAW